MRFDKCLCRKGKTQVFEDSRIWPKISWCIFLTWRTAGCQWNSWRNYGGIYQQNLWCKTFVSISKARYKVFQKKKEMPDPQVLPLSQDALKMHVTWANFRTMGWKNALSHHSAPLDLNNQGWRLTDESIEIRWMNQKPAPEILEELISCCCCCKKQTLKYASLSVQNSCLRIFAVFLNTTTIV